MKTKRQEKIREILDTILKAHIKGNRGATKEGRAKIDKALEKIITKLELRDNERSAEDIAKDFKNMLKQQKQHYENIQTRRERESIPRSM